MISGTLLLLLVPLALLVFYRLTRKPKNFPPGPPRLPLLGSLPYLADFAHKHSQIHINRKMYAKYGKIWGAFIGNTPLIKVGDLAMAKKLFGMEEFQGRPTSSVFMAPFKPGFGDPSLHGSIPGVGMSSGPHWRDQRRFALRNLRDMGMGKASMEESIVDEVQKLAGLLRKLKSGPVDLTLAFNASILNALWKLLCGETLELDDPKLKLVIQRLNDFFHTPFLTSQLLPLLPSRKFTTLPIIKDMVGYEQTKATTDSMLELIQERVEERRKTFDLEQEDNADFLDTFLRRIYTEKNPNSDMFQEMGINTLLSVFMDLFVAGSETTSTSLTWIFLYMIHHVDVQERVHEELDRVVGRDRIPSLDDLPYLHYTNAVLQEGFRLSGLAIDSVPHATTKEVTVDGYTFPKDTIVMSSLFSIMRNPEVFEKPDVFSPERFIDSDGKFIKHNHVVPFGVGTRFCLGQSLAEKEYFLFFTNIMQLFRFRAYPGMALPGYGIDDVLPDGPARTPPNFRVEVFERE